MVVSPRNALTEVELFAVVASELEQASAMLVLRSFFNFSNKKNRIKKPSDFRWHERHVKRVSC
jgi:hypothetical protein